MYKFKKNYFILLILVILSVSIIYFSYAIFTETKEYSGKLNMVAGSLDYKLESNDLIDNSITVAGEDIKIFNIDITSLNSISSKYKLYYKVNQGNLEDVVVGYTDNYDSSVGTIDSNGNKVVEVFVNNTSNEDVIVEFGVIGGFNNNELVLSEGSSLVLDNIGPDIDIRVETVDDKTYAYVEAYDELSGADYVDDGESKYFLPNEIEPMKIMAAHVIGTGQNAWYKDATNYEEIFDGHTVMVVNVDDSSYIQKAIDEEYDLVVLNKYCWGVYGSQASSLFAAGIDLITVGDDTTSLPIIDGEVNGVDTTLDIIVEPVVDNAFTKRMGFQQQVGDASGRAYINFIDEVEVLYRATVGDVVSDNTGYYNKNGVSWLHSQTPYHPTDSTDVGQFLKVAFDFITKKYMAKVEITESGDYTFEVVDHLGNISTETVHIDITEEES